MKIKLNERELREAARDMRGVIDACPVARLFITPYHGLLVSLTDKFEGVEIARFTRHGSLHTEVLDDQSFEALNRLLKS